MIQKYFQKNYFQSLTGCKSRLVFLETSSRVTLLHETFNKIADPFEVLKITYSYIVVKEIKCFHHKRYGTKCNKYLSLVVYTVQYF